ncbi:helix-turn-helix domain-containing protein [Paenibacillus sp. F411]|uniref:helix-turn-helix domain-containing protein n=1 Tax=Paenibacillus sp. F411 TaxID=2820239 RepID=UPI001AAFB562|nr:helix-turn-helix domain-containing protein [Paenibacillus sp. F411]MBO2942731.1 helix-turn-helix domain-containing protein [Paenibacillus sp. F411]
MAKKGQTFQSYSLDMKKRAIAMRLDGMTKKEVAQELQISDIGRLKIWMRKYRELGEEGLIDRRTLRSTPSEEDDSL